MLTINGILLPGARGQSNENNVVTRKVREARVKTGSEVVQRVNQLKQANKQVKNALKAFETNAQKNGHLPKIEDSWSVTSAAYPVTVSRAATPKVAGPLRKVSFKPQDTISEDGIEIIFIPVYSVPGEWQGTVICNRYDSSGNFLDQYVADLVLIQAGPSYSWTGLYEVSFEGSQSYLESDPALGMITDPYFEFGTPSNQQPSNHDGFLDGQVSSIANTRFLNINFSLVATTPQRFGIPGPRYPPNPRMNQWVRCTASRCVGTTVGCGALSTLTAGVSFGPCAVSACLGSAAACGLSTIFGL
ncbi:MAG TPA: hypothetical protein DC047_16390 [Blastocatellia bacterium]|nr:hypothetical protein [Blastocatellia bacterium]